MTALCLGSCGSEPDNEPAFRTVSTTDPLRVLLIGDSAMSQLSQAIIPALQGQGNASVRFLLTPSTRYVVDSSAAFRSELENFDPEIIVVMVGPWEHRTTLERYPVSERDWKSLYSTDLVEPALDQLTETGAEPIWVGFPPPGHPGWLGVFEYSGRSFDDLNQIYAERVQERQGGTYIDPNLVLADSDGRYLERRFGEDGLSQVLRAADGLHLCPQGAVALAEPIVVAISERARLVTSDGWQSGSWWDTTSIGLPAEDLQCER